MENELNSYAALATLGSIILFVSSEVNLGGSLGFLKGLMGLSSFLIVTASVTGLSGAVLGKHKEVRIFIRALVVGGLLLFWLGMLAGALVFYGLL